LSNSLVIVVAADSSVKLTSARDLTAPGIKRIALADPAGVPAGIYAKRYLEKMGVWREVAPKVVPVDNVRAALAAVEAGNVDAAIVYKTDVRMARRSKVALEIPASETPGIVYPVALVRESRNAAGGRAFIEFLSAKEASDIFRNAGFECE
jgi:molybdate transport system substrate-binding protein